MDITQKRGGGLLGYLLEPKARLPLSHSLLPRIENPKTLTLSTRERQARGDDGEAGRRFDEGRRG